MKLAQSRVTVQGQISVPAEVRKRLELIPGSVLEWDAEGDRITVRRAGRHTFEDLHRVLFPQKPRPKSLEELKEGIRQHVRARHARG
jgi:AbrB family looped-hinge helix DNA binding protein